MTGSKCRSFIRIASLLFFSGIRAPQQRCCCPGYAGPGAQLRRSRGSLLPAHFVHSPLWRAFTSILSRGVSPPDPPCGRSPALANYRQGRTPALKRLPSACCFSGGQGPPNPPFADNYGLIFYPPPSRFLSVLIARFAGDRQGSAALESPYTPPVARKI